jgi:hypothetical protein
VWRNGVSESGVMVASIGGRGADKVIILIHILKKGQRKMASVTSGVSAKVFTEGMYNRLCS